MALSHYVEDRQIRAMRVRTWVQAVMHTSGLDIAELEQRFTESKPGQSSTRSCIWDKYWRGEVVPRIGKRPNGSLNLVDRVEACYPGTASWLTSPIWRLADKAPMGMADIRQMYEGMPYLFRSIFVEAPYKTTGIFWRRETDIEECCDVLLKLEPLHSFIAFLTLIKEAEITQNQVDHWVATEKLIGDHQAKLLHHPVLKISIIELFKYLFKRSESAGYFE